jgi:AcrR family transcriptional regulator
MARPIAPTHAHKRDDILDAAALLFAQAGYSAAGMQGLAQACGISKATLYHYYRAKDELLHDLLDRYTQRLLLVVAETEASAQRQGLDDRATAHELVRRLLAAYEHSAARHAVLLNEVAHLPPEQAQGIRQRQRDLVAAATRLLLRAYPMPGASAQHINARTMMVFGMVNWTFTWLKPEGPMSYADFAQMVIQTLESGLHHA